MRTGLTDVFAGTICSVLTITYSLSYAALIFSGPLAHFLSYGIAVTFMSAAVGGAYVALRSSLPFAVAGPDSSISVVIAALVATVLQRVAAGGDTDLLAAAIIAMALGRGLCGLLMCVLAFTQAGRPIRFLPYPVGGGFLGATGWLMVTGAIQVVTDQHATLANLGAFAGAMTGAKLAAGAAVAIILHVLLRRTKSPFALPGVLLASFAAMHLVLLVSGTSIGAAQASGWMFHPQPAASFSLPWKTAALHAFPWSALPSFAGDVLAVMFVTISTLLLNTTGIEIATRTEANIERDLKVHGLANLLTGGLGGMVVCTSLSRSILVRTAGATSRLSGLTVAAISAGVLVADPSFLGYVPKYVLGGLLLYLGSDLVYQWLIHSSRRLLLLEYLSLIAIVIGCGTFALSASRVKAIKFNFDGSNYRSTLDRGPSELALLAEHGRQIQGMTLQSYLFFGSANRLYQYVKTLLVRQPDCRFLIFDFRLVTGIDSSATHSFAQIKQVTAAHGVRIVLVHLSPELERAFRTARFISDDATIVADLDRALESCEQKVIETHRAEAVEKPSLRAWLSDVLGSAEHADRLAAYCRRLVVEAGDIIAQQNEPAASMHFILEGRVGIIVDVGDGRNMRVRSLGRHTTIGEMGLITQRPRSATIQAETASVLYELAADDYETIKRDQPALSQALLAYVVAVMAERLSFANRVVGVLQR